MSNGFFHKFPLFLASLLLALTPFLFFPFFDEKIAFRAPKEAFSLCMISVICGAWGVRRIEEGGWSSEKRFSTETLIAFMRTKELTVALLLFCFYIFSSSLFSVNPEFTARVSFNVFGFSLFFLFLVSNMRKQSEIAVIKNSLILPAVVMGIYSIFQYHGHDLLFQPVEPYMKKFLVVSGFIDNPNLFAGYLVGVIPLSLAGVMAAGNKKKLFFRSTCFVVLVAALLLTNARTGLLSFFGSMLFFCLMKFARSLKKAFVTGMLLLALLSCAFFVTNKYYMAQSRKDIGLTDTSVHVRLLHWKTAWLMITDSPDSFLFGKGAGSFKLHYLDYRIEALKGQKDRPRFENSHHAHNEYIQLWAESGLVGLLLAASFLFIFFKKVFRTFQNLGRSTTDFTALTGYLASFLALLINALASFPFHIVPSALVAVTTAALSLSPGEEVP
ncbi:MAG: O-antigen ligase family protein [Nitrospinota bacterium]